VVEIAATTVERDRLLKARVYARAGIPAYWLVNLAEHQGVPVILDNVEVGRVSVDLLLGTGASRGAPERLR
jgi:Uma2 family endonuclease